MPHSNLPKAVGAYNLVPYENNTLSASVSPPQTAATGLIRQDMLEVDCIISQRLSSGVPLVGQVSQHIIQAGGKRLRPV
ncbi:MAG: hypothetical protein ACK44R_12835, partial [Burkholderiales bacterium]